MSLLRLLVPSRGTAIVATLLAVALRYPSKLPFLSPLKSLGLFVLFLNWRQFPLVWHIQVLGQIPLSHYRIWRYGIVKATSIGQSPFERKVYGKGYVSLDLADWNGHMSNTSYGRCLDWLRFKWMLEVFSPAVIAQGFAPVGGTSYVFLKEIPIGKKFEMEVRIASWDEKWIYYITRFTTSGRRGEPRQLNCLALSKSCIKIHGSRISIPPERILSLAGMGPDGSNWEFAKKLYKEKKNRAWVIYGGMEVVRKKALAAGLGESLANGNGNGMTVGKEGEYEPGWEDVGLGCYEEERKRRLEIVHGRPEGWAEL